MDLRQITPTYAVTPQIELSAVAELAKMGVKTLICNRPDSENPADLSAAAFQREAEAHGIDFVFNPFQGHSLTMSHVEEQADAIAGSDGPVVAYCASGNRSTIVWALGAAGEVPVDEIVAKAASFGYDLSGLVPALNAAAEQNRA